MVVEISQFFDVFKMAAVRHLGFAECVFDTTHKEYLVVFIIVQNLVEIDRVVLHLAPYCELGLVGLALGLGFHFI